MTCGLALVVPEVWPGRAWKTCGLLEKVDQGVELWHTARWGWGERKGLGPHG